MKITDPDVIKNGEKDLLEAVREDLDLDTVREILKEKMNASALASKGGEIIVHNNDIAFRLDFSVQLSGSLMFDRQGNYIPGSADEPAEKDDASPENIDLDDLNIDEALEEATSADPGDSPDSMPADPQTAEEEPEDLDIQLPDFDTEEDTSQEAASQNLEGADEEDLIDEDIDEILKESREFWEKKNEP